MNTLIFICLIIRKKYSDVNKPTHFNFKILKSNYFCFFFGFAGYGWLNIDIKGLNAGFRRENLSNFGVEGYYPKLSIKIYIQSLGTEAVFVKEIDNEQKKSWFSINEVYRTERISKDTFITVDIMNADTIIYHEKNTITDFVKKFILKVENRDLWVKFMYYPIWLDEYSYEEYLKTPFEGNFECPINGKTLDDLTHQDSQEVF